MDEWMGGRESREGVRTVRTDCGYLLRGETFVPVLHTEFKQSGRRPS